MTRQEKMRCNTKLTRAQVREIKQALAEGHSGSQLAKEYGVSRQNINLIKLGKRWNDITIGSEV